MAQMPLVGEVVDRYRIEGVLGSGGMATVFVAYDPRLRRQVALKLVTDTSNADASPRLKREALAVASFTHPNIVAVFDVGETSYGPFIAMELVRGKTLRDALGEASVPLAEKMRWLRDVARALAAAHARGIVHRDVKPGNVMVSEEGVVKVLDFGIARSIDPGPPSGREAVPRPQAATRASSSLVTLTEEGSRVGTPRYMAPEQMSGEASDGRTDQFAWAVVAYELLAGRHQWLAPDELEGAQFTAPPPPIRTFVPELDPRVDAIVSRALRASPDERFASMDEVLAALEPCLDGPERAPRPRSRARLLALPAAAALAVASLAWALRRDAREAPAAAPTATALRFTPRGIRQLTFHRACDEFPTFTPDGRAVVFDGTDGANSRIFVVDAGGGEPRALTTVEGWDVAPAVSPDGASVAFLRMTDDDNAIFIAPLDGRDPPRRLLAGDVRPRWSRDGRGVWGGDPHAAAEYDARTGARLRQVSQPTGSEIGVLVEVSDGLVVAQFQTNARELSHGGIAVLGAVRPPRWLLRDETDEVLELTPDRRHVLAARITATGENEILGVPLDGAPVVSLAMGGFTPGKGLALSPDGRRVVWSTCRSYSEIVAVHGTTIESRPLAEPAHVHFLVGLPGKRRILAVTARTTWELDVTRATSPIARLTGSQAREISASSDSARVVYATDDGLFAATLDGEGPRVHLTDNDGGVSDGAPSFWEHDSALLFTRYFPGGASQVMSMPAQGGPVTPVLERGSCFSVPSPDGERIAYLDCAAAGAPVPMLWTRSQKRARPLSPQLGPGVYDRPAFSPDGKRVGIVRNSRSIAEIDVESGQVVREVAGNGASIAGIAYSGEELFAIRASWRGSVWLADLGE
jgi:serine/threonine-protein kinase